MKYIDTNIIIRFLMKDQNDLFEKAYNIIMSDESLFIMNEVLAESVFVLSSVYKVKKKEICRKLTDFLSIERIFMYDKKLIIRSLNIFRDNNMDFIDCILCALSEQNRDVLSFDKKVNNYITK